MSWAYVGTTDSECLVSSCTMEAAIEKKFNLRVDDRTAHEVWVVFREDEFSGVLIDCIVYAQVAQKWGR